MRKFLWAVGLSLVAATGFAQDSKTDETQAETDRGFVAGLLEDALGGDGRTVRIEGFAGALSSSATVQQITFADPQGVWLSLDGVTLQWNRGALLRGAVEIETLKSDAIVLTRLPASGAQQDLPTPEAQGFSLPELPVSVNIGKLAADRIELGKAVLGEAAVLSLTASLSLESGVGAVDLLAQRIDGADGRLSVKGNYSNATTDLALDLDLSEGPGGIAVTVLKIPEAPKAQLTINAKGTLSELQADLTLLTNDTPHVAGTLVVNSEDDRTRRFSADIGGDVSALLDQAYAPFFGEQSQIIAKGAIAEDGSFVLEQADIQTEALRLQGQVALNADGWPNRLDITGALGMADGSPVRLPAGGTPITLQGAELAIQYDADDGEAWTGRIEAQQVVAPGAGFGNLSLTGGGTIVPDAGQLGAVTAKLDFQAQGFDPDNAALLTALGAAFDGQVSIDYTEEAPIEISGLSLRADGLTAKGTAQISALEQALKTRFNLSVQADDFSRLSDLSGQQLSGSGKVDVTGSADLGGAFDIQLSAQTRDLGIGIEQADAVLSGDGRAEVDVRRDETGMLLRKLSVQTPQALITADGTLGSTDADLQFEARLADVAAVVPQYSGPVTANGRAQLSPAGWLANGQMTGPYGITGAVTADLRSRMPVVDFDLSLPEAADLGSPYKGAVRAKGQARQTSRGWEVESDLSAPLGLKAQVEALVAETTTVDFDLRLPDAADVGSPYSGPVTASGRAEQTTDGWQVVTNLTAPLGATASASANIGETITVDYALALPNVAELGVPYSGALTADGQVRQVTGGWQVETQLDGPYGLTGTALADLVGAAHVSYDLSLPNVASLGAPFAGAVKLSGTVSQQGDAWSTRTDLKGPAGMQAKVTGQVAPQMDVAAQGNLPLGLLNPLVAPRSLQGGANFDLALSGAPDIANLRGTVGLQGGSIVSPSERLSVEGLTGTVQLRGGQALISITGRGSEGGGVAVDGSVGLGNGNTADLAVRLNGLALSDPQLYRTTVNGAVNVNGPLSGGASITGTLNVGETLVTIPSTFVGALSAIPDIKHIGATRPVMRTLDRAQLTSDGKSNGGGSSRPFGLNLTINAPSRVFVRGRGLDAELGGALQISGTTANIVSSGGAELIRGRLDILNRRFDLDEGRVQLLGDFDPYIYFLASTDTDTGTASVVVEGRASAPEVRFTSVPELPEDQVLAQLLFSRDITQLSALQALELASAVATLAGRGGLGIVGRLRESFNLDDLDVTSDETGNAQLRAGKYISDNVYTDVTVGQDSAPEVSLNIDLTPNVTARGTLGSDGGTSLGVFFEKDY